MKKIFYFISAAFLMIAAAACTGGKEKSVAECETPATEAAIVGSWQIDSIVMGDSVKVCPTEEVPDMMQSIILRSDSSYNIVTNCNRFFGSYAVNGDSIILGDGGMTEMACENMVTEDAIRMIMPFIATYKICNDTVLRLCGRDASEFILLHKVEMAEEQQ